jgi:DNA-binding HxlR family transcriptional regulator
MESVTPRRSAGRPHDLSDLAGPPEARDAPPPAADPTAGSAPAALEWAVERVGDRWTLLIVHALLAGPLRFGELADAVPGIASNVLSQRLKRLEADGLLISTAYSARPPRFSYELTQAGRELGGVLALLAHWGAVAGGGEGLRHSLCGTSLEARWWCPTCDRPVDDPDDEGELRFV